MRAFRPVLCIKIYLLKKNVNIFKNFMPNASLTIKCMLKKKVKKKNQGPEEIVENINLSFVISHTINFIDKQL